MPCPQPREVTSTVAEHETLAARDHVSTNAPGRTEGSREHTNLAVTSVRDMRHDDVQSRAHEPRGHVLRGVRHSGRPRPHDASHVKSETT
jgi:hypothetical protein